MKTIFVLLALAALANADNQWTTIHVKWSLLDLFGLDSWYDIPFDKSAAVEAGWVPIDGVSSISTVSSYCMENDPVMVMHYDSYGNPCGFQMAIAVSGIKDSGVPYDYTAKSMYTVKTMYDKEYYTTTVYTVDPDILETDGGRADAGGVLGTGEGVWVQDRDSGYVKIPGDASGLLEAGFEKQNCVAKMGTHYYANITTDMDCQNWAPYFVVTDNDGYMHGIGLQGFGPAETINRLWYESIPVIFADGIFPVPPTCLMDWGDKYGVISLHIYFKEDPWDFTCS